MFRFLGLCFGTLVRLFRTRQRLLIENLVLRQQFVVLKRRHPRPKLDWCDKVLWLLVRRRWSGWKQAFLVVTPETVVRWHRTGYWKVISKVRKPERGSGSDLPNGGREPTWGAPPDSRRTAHARF